jgi:murein DD-endopeptidase / murein LD-carboxypeptidase
VNKQSIKNILIALLLIPILISAASCSSSKKTKKKKKESVKKEIVEKQKTESKDKQREKELIKKYATLMNISESDLKNVKLLEFIDEWYGVPYKYGGKSKEGVDCSNFTTLLMQNVYNKTIVGPSESIQKSTKEININNLKEGDLVFFKIEQKKVSHVGIIIHDKYFVHATTKKGVMLNHLDENYYKKYFYKAGRL